MKIFLSLVLAFSLTQPVLAQATVELPTLQGEMASCVAQAGQLVQGYLEIVSVGASVKAIRFENFANTSPGSFYQEYEADLSLTLGIGADTGTDKKKLHVTFTSPFICDELKILAVKDEGIDTDNDLYRCLNDQSVFGPLRTAGSKAFNALQDFHMQVCGESEGGAETVNCWKQANGTSQGRKLLADIRVTDEAINAAWSSCQAQFGK